MKTALLILSSVFAVNAMADFEFNRADAQKVLKTIQTEGRVSNDCEIKVAYNDVTASVSLKKRTTGEVLAMEFPLNSTRNFYSSKFPGSVTFNGKKQSYNDGLASTNYYENGLWVTMRTVTSTSRQIETQLSAIPKNGDLRSVMISQRTPDRCFPDSLCAKYPVKLTTIFCSF